LFNHNRIHHELAKVQAGIATPLRTAIQATFLTGATRDGRMLVVRETDAGWMTADGAYTSVSAPNERLFTDGERIFLFVEHGVDEILPGGERVRVDLAEGSSLVCGNGACASLKLGDDALVVRRLEGGTLGPETGIAVTGKPEVWGAALSDDGRVALLDENQATVTVIDLATSKVEAWRSQIDGECGGPIQSLAWRGHELYATSLCAHANSHVFQLTRDAAPVDVFASTAWIAGLAFDRDGTLLVNLKQHSSELELVDGL
jgi:DNA-binding beta-propeller fold protein YncE